ncbi:hypothetical protein ACVWYH_005564 [Bradyrhizobium sp. GM24.11]
MNKPIDVEKRSQLRATSDTNDVMAQRARADVRPVKPNFDIESLTVIVFFSTAGLFLSLAPCSVLARSHCRLSGDGPLRGATPWLEVMRKSALL